MAADGFSVGIYQGSSANDILLSTQRVMDGRGEPRRAGAGLLLEVREDLSATHVRRMMVSAVNDLDVISSSNKNIPLP